MLNRLGRLSLRVSNAGLTVLVFFIAERLLSAQSFGELYIILGLSSVFVGFIDFYNQKYMIDLYSRRGNILIPELVTIKFMTLIFIPVISLSMYYFFSVSLSLTMGIAIYTVLVVISQTFSIALFCSANESRHLLMSNIIGLIVFLLVLAGYIRFVNKSQLAFVLAIIFYKIFELGYYVYVFIRLHKVDVVSFSLVRVKYFIKENKRNIFYIQWVLSLLSAKAGTLILPHVVTYDNISVFAKFTIISSFIYFWLSFSASTFYSEICSAGITERLIKKKAIEIVLISLISCFIVFVLSRYYYPVLFGYMGYIIAIIITMSITCYQGYLLFYLKLDSNVLHLSILTLVLSNLCYFIFPSYFGVKGIFISNLFVEFFSLVATIYILYTSRAKYLDARSSGNVIS